MAKAQPAVVVDDQNWDAAFDAAALEGAKTVQEPVKEVPEKEAPAKSAEDTAAEAAAAKAAEEKAAADAKAAEEAAAAQKVKDEANKGKTAEEIAAEEKAATAAEEKAALATKAREEAEARAAADAKVRSDAEARVAAEAKAKADADAKTKAETERKARAELLSKPYEPSAEEKAALEKFKIDFPNEYVAVEARLKGVDREIQRQVHAAVQATMEHVGKVVTPLSEGFAEVEAERHATAVRVAHPDTDEVVPLVDAWIKTQPSYLQDAYKKVYDNGSTKEVIDLFTRFKTETGYKATKPAPKPAPKSGPTQEEIDSGAPVGGRRAAPNPKGGTPDMENYDGAFAEAAAAK